MILLLILASHYDSNLIIPDHSTFTSNVPFCFSMLVCAFSECFSNNANICSQMFYTVFEDTPNQRTTVVLGVKSNMIFVQFDFDSSSKNNSVFSVLTPVICSVTLGWNPALAVECGIFFQSNVVTEPASHWFQ